MGGGSVVPLEGRGTAEEGNGNVIVDGSKAEDNHLAGCAWGDGGALVVSGTEG